MKFFSMFLAAFLILATVSWAQSKDPSELNEQLYQILEQQRWDEGIPLIEQLASQDPDQVTGYELFKTLLQDLSSQPLDIPNPSTPVRQFQRPTELNDCGSSFDCFSQAAQQCQPSRLTYIQSSDVFGFLYVCLQVIEIWGDAEGQCVTHESCPINRVGLTPAMESLLQQQNDPQTIDQLKNAQNQPVPEQICLYPESQNISQYHSRKFKGEGVGLRFGSAAVGDLATSTLLLDDNSVANCESVNPITPPPLPQ